MSMRVTKAIMNKENELKELVLSMYDREAISHEAAMELIDKSVTKEFYTDDSVYDTLPDVPNPLKKRCGYCLRPWRDGEGKYSLNNLMDIVFHEDMLQYYTFSHCDPQSVSPEFLKLLALIREKHIMDDVCENCFMKLMDECFGEKRALEIKKELESRLAYDVWHVDKSKKKK